MSSLEKQLVVVLGMHKSGTSLVASMVERAGFFLGEDESILLPNSYNVLGYYENDTINSVNDALLSQMGVSWDLEQKQGEQTQANQKDLKNMVKEATQSLFANHNKVVMKDPRMSITLKYWREAFTELSINVKYLLVFRNPLEVHQSLERRDQFSLEKSLRLWLEYNQAIQTELGADEYLLVDYNYLLEHAVQSTGLILDYILDGYDDKLLQQIAAIPSPVVRHSQADNNEILDNKQVPTEIKKLYQELQENYLATIKQSGQADEQLDPQVMIKELETKIKYLEEQNKVKEEIIEQKQGVQRAYEETRAELDRYIASMQDVHAHNQYLNQELEKALRFQRELPVKIYRKLKQILKITK